MDGLIWLAVRRMGHLALYCILFTLAACGGGNTPGTISGPSPWPDPARAIDAPQKLARTPLRATASTRQPTATELLDWAQDAYPQYFPAAQPDLFSAPYIYRCYPQTGNCVGLADDSVYILGPVSGGALTRVGAVSDFACAVFFDECSSVAPIDIHGTLVSPAAINLEIANGGYMPNTSLNLRFTGDPKALVGRTVYAYIVDPWGFYDLFHIFGPTSAGDGSATVNVALTGKRQVQGGVKAGSLKLYACLDPQCATRIAGSPFTVPYNVNVGDGVKFASDRIDLTVLTTDPRGTSTMAVTLPRYTTSWKADLDPYTYLYSVGSTADSGRLDTGTVFFSMPRQLPGTYTQKVKVTAWVTMPAGTQYSTASSFEVSKVVTGTVQPAYAFSPEAINITLPFNSKGWRPLDFTVTLREGVNSLRYLSWENGGNQWLRGQQGTNQGTLGIDPCPDPEWRGSCLLPGVYRGAISYDLYDTVYGISYGRPGVPVTLTITP